MNDRSPPSPPDVQLVTFDAIMPAAIAARAEEAGVTRAALDPLALLVLSLLAGAFVAFGAVAATTIGAGASALPFGIVRLLTGIVFCTGLIMVVIGGAELFTGNSLIVIAWASGRVKTRDVLFNWVVVYLGNVAGGMATAALMFLTTQYTFDSGSVGLVAITTANAKSSFAFIPALTLGIMCNVLVCLAVWMCYSARTNVDRILTLVPPVAAFVIAGFEHCIANAYFIPLGLFIKAGAPESFWAAIGKTPADFPDLTWTNFLLGNMLPVTLGNVIGGSILVAAVYWFIYLRSGSGMRR
jgi:formate/nitrite transporter